MSRDLCILAATSRLPSNVPPARRSTTFFAQYAFNATSSIVLTGTSFTLFARLGLFCCVHRSSSKNSIYDLLRHAAFACISIHFWYLNTNEKDELTRQDPPHQRLRIQTSSVQRQRSECGRRRPYRLADQQVRLVQGPMPIRCAISWQEGFGLPGTGG